MKRTVLKARMAGAVGLASISMIALAACGGGGSVTTGGENEKSTTEASSEPATSEAPTSEAATTEAPTSEAVAPGEITDQDLDAAEQTFIDFFTAAANKDYATACKKTINPATKEPMTDADAQLCAKNLESSSSAEGIDPSLASYVTKENLEAKASDDGTIKISIMGSEFPYSLSKAADGNWYITLS